MAEVAHMIWNDPDIPLSDLVQEISSFAVIASDTRKLDDRVILLDIATIKKKLFDTPDGSVLLADEGASYEAVVVGFGFGKGVTNDDMYFRSFRFVRDMTELLEQFGFRICSQGELPGGGLKC